MGYILEMKWTKETMEKNLSSVLDYQKEIKSECKRIIDIIKQFDGKVFNARLENAINEGNNYNYETQQYKRSFFVNIKTPKLENGKAVAMAEFADMRYRSMIKEIIYYPCFDVQVQKDDNGNYRINASKTILSVSAFAQYVSEKVKEYKASIKNYDKAAKQLKDIDERIKKYNDTRNNLISPYIYAQV